MVEFVLFDFDRISVNRFVFELNFKIINADETTQLNRQKKMVKCGKSTALNEHFFSTLLCLCIKPQYTFFYCLLLNQEKSIFFPLVAFGHFFSSMMLTHSTELDGVSCGGVCI